MANIKGLKPAKKAFDKKNKKDPGARWGTGGKYGDKSSPGKTTEVAQGLDMFYGPEALMEIYNTLMSQMASSPMFQNQLKQMAMAGQAGGNQIQNQLGRSGLGGTGLGQVAGGVGRAMTGLGAGNAYGQMSGNMFSAAQDNNNSRLGAFNPAFSTARGTKEHNGMTWGDAGQMILPGLIDAGGSLLGGGIKSQTQPQQQGGGYGRPWGLSR